MINKDQYKNLIMFLASTLILLVQVAIFYYIWNKYYNYSSVIGIMYFRWGYYALLAIYAIINFFFSKIFGAYKVGYLKVSEVVLSQILSVLCCNAVTYIQLALIGRWRFLHYVKPVLIMTAYDIIAVLIWIVFARWVYEKLFPARRLLLIYGKISPKELIRKITTRNDKYVIVAAVCLDEGFDEVVARMKEYEAVIIGDIPSTYRNKLLKYCYINGIRCYTIPKISDIMIKSSTTINLFDTELYLFRNRGLTVEQSFFKRLFDILISIIMLVLLSPLLIATALAIKLYDRGPVLYRQERLTINHQVFMIYKFRSMRVNSEGSSARLANADDDRITPVGRVIRRLHIDELPQLFNILHGEMSFVGPRPERPEIAKLYCQSVPEFEYRLKMKAGLTGYAQVFGNYRTTPLDKLKLDLTYIENYSLGLDFLIVIQTVKIFFQKDSSQGLEGGAKTALKNGGKPETVREDIDSELKERKGEEQRA